MERTLRTWAANWTGVDQGAGIIAKREPELDGLFAEFRSAGRLVKIHASQHELAAFGEARNGDKQAHAERVLRAILETYIDRFRDVPANINARDLGKHLYPLQIEFQREVSQP
jgi:hypothetical protein